MGINGIQNGIRVAPKERVLTKKASSEKSGSSKSSSSVNGKQIDFSPAASISTVQNVNAIQSDYIATKGRIDVLSGVETDLNNLLGEVGSKPENANETKDLKGIIQKVSALKDGLSHGAIDKEKLMQEMMLPLENKFASEINGSDVLAAASLITKTANEVVSNPTAAATVQTSFNRASVASILSNS